MRFRLALLLFAVTGLGFAQAPSILDGGIVNGASFAAGQPITGGSLVSIFGTHLASQLASADTIPLSTQLGGVTVQFQNGTTTANAPLLFAGPGNPDLINAQVPWEIVPPNTTQTVNVIVNVNGVASPPKQVTVGPFSPGIFSVNGMAVVVNNSDGTLAWPTGSVPGLTTHPAKHHDVMIIYATGMGAVMGGPPADGANAGSQILSSLVNPTILVGGIPVTGSDFIYSVLSPQFVGLYQVAFFVPQNAPTGNAISLQIQMGGITSPVNLTMAITQ